MEQTTDEKLSYAEMWRQQQLMNNSCGTPMVYLLLAVFRPENLFVIGAGVAVEYFGYGFGFVGLMLFMMQQVSPGRHQMAHYAFATAIMNLGVMMPSMASGYLSDWLGYKTFFIWVLIATIPAFLVTVFVPFVYPDHREETVKVR